MISKVGIIINTVGTITTLLIVFSTKVSEIGTYRYYDGKMAQKRAKQDRWLVVLGIFLIVIGTILQLI